MHVFSSRYIDQLYLGTLISFNIMLISKRGVLANFYNFNLRLIYYYIQAIIIK